MSTKTLALASLLSIAALGMPANAAVVSVEARNLEFRPAGIGAALGDTVRWNVTSGQHRIVGYQGATFDTGPVSAGMTAEWSNDAGGFIRYRCTLHSTLEAGVCDGMCGALSDAPPAIAAPTITAPTDGASIDAPGATISGSAPSSAATVRIYDDGALIGETAVSGTSFSRGFSFATGTHTITAVAIDADGFRSSPSAAVTFTIEAPDTQAPRVDFQSPTGDTIVFGTFEVRVLALDNVAVTSLTVSARDMIVGTTSEIHLACEPGACAGERWLMRGTASLGTGLWELTGAATDAAGNTGTEVLRVVAVR